MHDAEHKLGATEHQAEHGCVAAGELPKGGQPVGQQRGTGEKEANIGHQCLLPAVGRGGALIE
jgi:hypothetical protein